ncbi:MAG: thioesterase family protein [Gloeomargarita sp. SKYBB_i_bin120]|nr:acyl-CoA thioesterase [Gloeomargarita sp. SKYG98]MCS7292331.1 acyl-CoA thioesterase [Gloeomargarita sp. SKYB120]MDW8177891.1 thioesterase family protein [Gloeomargarita sp. SKYBB_i_bin120]
MTWFVYPVQVYPQDTDYGGVVWHGRYLYWLEQARVAWLEAQGVRFRDLVAADCDLPVVELSIRYHKPVHLGDQVCIKARPRPRQGVRLVWDYELTRQAELVCTAVVTLAPLNRTTGKLYRRLPPPLAQVFPSRLETHAI